MALTPSNSHGPGGTAASPDVVVGNVASGVADSGAPVKAGGKYNSTLPTFVDGQRGDLQLDSRGGTQVVIKSLNGTGGANVPAETDAGTAGSFGLLVVPRNSLFNATSWDRQRANEPATLLASAARTVTTSSADQTNYNGKGVLIVFECTAEAGATDILTLTVQGKDSISGSYYDLITGIVVYTTSSDSPTRTRAIALKPGVLTADAIGAGNTNLISQKSVVLPRVWRATITPTTADSHTYSLSAVTIL